MRTYGSLDVRAPPFLISAPAALTLSPRYPLYRRVVGPHSPSGRCGGEKNTALLGIKTVQHIAVSVPAELSLLLCTVHVI
jgi:hypothetical protein